MTAEHEDQSGRLRRAVRSLPAIAWRDRELAALRADTERLQEEIERLRGASGASGASETRGPDPEPWSAPRRAVARKLVTDSGLFDGDWYLTQVDDEAAAADPLRHYLEHGASAGLTPHPAFVPSWYVDRVRAHGGYGSLPRISAAPLLHYLQRGGRRLLSPHPAFDPTAFVDEQPEAAEEPHGPLVWFLAHGVGTARPVPSDLPPGAREETSLPGRERDAFLAVCRRAAEVVRDTRGYLHLDRDRPTFDVAAETRLKEEVRGGRDRTRGPKVSVVMPTKDRAAAVTEAVASVLAQTYVDWELIVADDGSQDDTVEALARLTDDPRVTVTPNTRTPGVSGARNTALDHATGEYVAYLDSDNTWKPDFLELMVAFLTDGGHQVGYGMSALTEQGGQGRQRFRGMPFVRGALRERNFIDCIVVVHERALLERAGGFDESLRRTVDWDLLIRLADLADFAYLPVIATEYDTWDTGTERISTDVPAATRHVVLQRTLVDLDALRANVASRRDDLVSVVLAATHDAGTAAAAVRRLRATASGEVEVVVVDNHLDAGESTRLVLDLDGVDGVTVTRLSQRLTLEVARNTGAGLTTGATLVFLAENAWTESGWDEPLVAALREHVVVQPVTLSAGGDVWSAGLYVLADGHSVAWGRGMAGDSPEVRGLREVDAVTAACLAVRAADFAEVRGFDPRFADHTAGGELSLRLATATGRTVACHGASPVALRAVFEQDGGRPGVVSRRGRLRVLSDNRRQHRELAARATAAGPRDRAAADGLRVECLQGGADPGQPSTPLVVRERGERPLRWAIKIGAPDVPRREAWGDWHFAAALRDSLERLGHEAVVDCRDQWYRPTTHLDDVVVMLRGRYYYEVQPQQTSVLWVISHPDLVSVPELQEYDLVLGASARWCARASLSLGRPVETLLQCTDQHRFHPVPEEERLPHGLLAVANSRPGRLGSPRASVAAALEAGLTPEVYGRWWDGILPPGSWRGVYLPNEHLAAAYAGADAVLNDHWPDMREAGLLSNRLFDLAACDARVISDHLPEVAEVFGDAVLTFDDAGDLPRLLATHREETEERRAARLALGERVRTEHTFDARARTLSDRVLASRAAERSV